MRRGILYFLFLGIMLIVVLPWLIVNFNLGEINYNFNSENGSRIGNTIGGITTPIVGLLSAFFLYFAIVEQRKTTDLSSVVNLYKILDNEIDSIAYRVKRNDEWNSFTGPQALIETIRNNKLQSYLVTNADAYNTLTHLNLIISSFDILRSKIEKSDLPTLDKKLWTEKIHVLYATKLKFGMTALLDAIEKEELKSLTINRICNFVKSFPL